MKELAKLTITRRADHHNCPYEFDLAPRVTEEDGKIEYLQHVKDLACELKDGFENERQEMVVEVRSMYDRDKEEEILMDLVRMTRVIQISVNEFLRCVVRSRKDYTASPHDPHSQKEDL